MYTTARVILLFGVTGAKCTIGKHFSLAIGIAIGSYDLLMITFKDAC